MIMIFYFSLTKTNHTAVLSCTTVQDMEEQGTGEEGVRQATHND